jgi:hypothetical protein
MVTNDSSMRDRPVRSRRDRWGLRGMVAVAIVIVVVGAFSSISAMGLQAEILGSLGVLGFTAVGALILERRPGEPVGRICLAVGIVFSIAAIFRLIVGFIDGLAGPLPPIGAALAVVGSTLSSLALLLCGPLLISRFPDRAAAAWQRRAEDLLMAAVGLVVVVAASRPGPVEGGLIEPAANPLAVDWLPADADAVFTVIAMTYAAAYLVTSFGLLRRYRRGGPIVRAQIRWFAASIAISLGLLGVVLATTDNEALNNISWFLWIASLLLPPVAITIAILRYRLYDIDRIVSNAIGYGVVTLVLFSVFAIVNLALVSQVSPLVDNEGIAVAASTLVVAGLFNPLRTSVQRSVDRRFHRARYDAERTVRDFATRLRDELDLATLATDLASTTVTAVEPASAVLWLRAR